MLEQRIAVWCLIHPAHEPLERPASPHNHTDRDTQP